MSMQDLYVGIKLLTYVKSVEEYSKAKESYDMSKPFKRLINRYLQYHKRLQEINNMMITGKLDKELAESEIRKLQHEKDLIDRSKTYLLNSRIFPAMADLTVLLEKMKEVPYIRQVFEDNVNDLFFARSKTNLENQSHIFARFLFACVAKPESTRTIDPSNEQTIKDTNPQNDFSILPDARFILGEYMQRAVLVMVQGIESRQFGSLTFLQERLLNDIKNAVQWITLLAQRAHDHLEIDEDRRPALF